MVRAIIEIIMLLLIVIVILTAVALNYYKKCPAGSMLVVFNNKPDVFGSTVKIIKSGGAFVWPFGGSFVILDLSPFPVDIFFDKIIYKDGSLRNFKAKLILSISTYEEEVKNAIERISGLGREKVIELSRDIISGHLRSFFLGISKNEIVDHLILKNKIAEELEQPLEDIGLRIMNMDLMELQS